MVEVRRDSEDHEVVYISDDSDEDNLATTTLWNVCVTVNSLSLETNCPSPRQ